MSLEFDQYNDRALTKCVNTSSILMTYRQSIFIEHTFGYLIKQQFTGFSLRAVNSLLYQGILSKTLKLLS